MTTEPPIEYPSAEQALAPGETFRILFLDSADQIERLKGTCKDVGYVVVGAETISEAMAFLEGKNHVDVIVCAAHLEVESMFAFLQHVRNHALHTRSMFLILSLEAGPHGAYFDRSSARAGVALGANAYVVMPVFDPVELIAQIRALLPAVPVLQQAASPEEK